MNDKTDFLAIVWVLLFLIFTIFSVGYVEAESEITIEVHRIDRFYATQYMCISEAVSCAFDISEKVNPDKEAEVEKAKDNCCLKLAYCVTLVDALHPTVYDFDSETEVKDTDYINKVNDTYQTSCMASGTNEPLRLPSATKLN